MNVNCLYDALVPISELKLNPKNRNEHPKDQIKRLAEILKYQGWRYPVKISKQTGLVTSGHARVAAAKMNRWKEVPVNFQDYQTTEQEYADTISDNSIAWWAELDLSGINVDLIDLGPDFNIDLLGIKDFTVEPADKLTPGCDEDEAPEPPKKPKTAVGDLWILGNHRLLCGDATSIDAVEKLMCGQKADMVFTDPPYNTGMTNKKGQKNGSTWLNHFFDDAFTEDEWQALLSGMCASYWTATKDSAALYICLDWRRSHELVPHLKQYFKFSNLIIWDKIVHGLGSDYKYTHEFIHVCKKGDPTLNTHQGDREYQDIWRIQRKMGKDEDHATKKPVALVERALLHASQPQDLVLDLFGGSGSTLIAAGKVDRRCYIMELLPSYCDLILSRWSKYTGQDPVRDDGKCWSELNA